MAHCAVGTPHDTESPRVRSFQYPKTEVAIETLMIHRFTRFFAICATALSCCSIQSELAQAEVLFEIDSLYHHVRVTEEGDYRYLSFDRTRGSQSVVNTSDLDELKFPYTRAMFTALAFLHHTPERVLFVGLGGGTMPRIMAKYFPECQIDIAEIDPVVVRVAKRFFFFDPTPQMDVHTQDGRQFLRRTPHKYDLIFLDAYNHQSIPFHLTTIEFFRIVKKKTKEDGAVASNVWSPSSNEYHYAQIKTLQEVFPKVYEIKATGSSNHIFISTLRPDDITAKDLRNRMEAIKEQVNLPYNFDPYIATSKDITDKNIDADHLTDDFAPVELLRAQKADNR